MTAGLNGPACRCGHPRGAHSYDTGKCVGGYCTAACQEFRVPDETPPLPDGILDVGRHAFTLSELKEQADRMRGIYRDSEADRAKKLEAKPYGGGRVVTGGDPARWSIALHHVDGGDPDEIRLFPRDGGGEPLVFHREETRAAPPLTITQDDIDAVQVGTDGAGPYLTTDDGYIDRFDPTALPGLIEGARAALTRFLAVQQCTEARAAAQREDRYAQMWAALDVAVSWEDAVIEEHPYVPVVRQLVDAGGTPPAGDQPF